MSWCEHFTACLKTLPWVYMEGVLTNGLTMVGAKGLQCNGGEGEKRDFKGNRS